MSEAEEAERTYSEVKVGKTLLGRRVSSVQFDIAQSARTKGRKIRSMISSISCANTGCRNTMS